MAHFAIKFIMSKKLASAVKSKDTIAKPLADGIKRTVLFYEGTTKKHTPVGTPESTGTRGYAGGRLRSSITHSISPSVSKVGTNVNYAQFVEYGTKNMAARHVTSGSSRRVPGKGPFTRALEVLQEWLGVGKHKIDTEIEKRFGD